MSELEQRSRALRQELKVWEKTFAANHGGRKAGRDDIKADAAISQKYKEYNRLRDNSKATPHTPLKRPASHTITQDTDGTLETQQSILHVTPLKRKHDSGVDVADGPIILTELLSPQGPTMIGPTPQRDGIVLGLFDLLPAETPSRKRPVLAEMEMNMVQTPTRQIAKTESEASLESRARGEKTPVSVGKRFMLDRLVTPQKRKRGEEGTPSSALKISSTPAFLRRQTLLDTVTEDPESAPRAAPWKRSFGRSLSSMIQSMKQQEEDRLDEEASIMQQLEFEAESISVPKKQQRPDIFVRDSQSQVSLDLDGFLPSEEEPEDDTEGQDQNAAPLRIWKKRGQKRQTRRIIMRPSFTKPKVPHAVQTPKKTSVTEAGATEPPLARDKITGNMGFAPGEDDDDDSDYASDRSHTPKQRRIVEGKAVSASAKPPESVDKAEPKKKTIARKIKATANANYRKLKIKSRKGNGGKGYFGRKR